MATILFVVEGEKRELGIFNNLSKNFFSGKDSVLTIFAPAGMNVYMLYCKLKEDNFETDVVEIIRESSEKAAEELEGYSRSDFSEIYFFFDFDEHGNNIPNDLNMSNVEILGILLETFDNETENGKLYISYPMVEALRDYDISSCKTISGSCFRNRMDFGTYKNDSAKVDSNNGILSYNYANWYYVINNFIRRICCLFGTTRLDYYKYIGCVNPLSIFEKELLIYDHNYDVFILSALPEFLLDYSSKIWNKAIGRRKYFIINDKCHSENGLIIEEHDG